MRPSMARAASPPSARTVGMPACCWLPPGRGGPVSSLGGEGWDAGGLVAAAVPAALGKARPGSVEFRMALRDALEQLREVPGAHGIFSMSETDHLGLDQRARVMVKIENGA